MKHTRKDILKRARRVVIKIGSTVVANRVSGVNQARIRSLSEELAWLRGKGIEVIVVTSGAVAAGMAKLGLSERPKTIDMKQAAAAVGQSALIRMYEKSLSKHGIGVGQMLLTGADLIDRRRFLNARNTLNKLVEFGVIPIINENDTVSVEELKFSDNDNLAALVTNLAGADTLVILSDVDGLYDKDPSNPDARLIEEVEHITKDVERMAGGACSLLGTGGMSSKICAAGKAAAGGTACFIINGRKSGNIKRLFEGERVGTLIMPGSESLSSKKHWIAFTMRGKGRVTVDDGAARAILTKGKSLLPSGIKSAEGKFSAGDAVEICREDGSIVARGLIHYSREEIEKIKGLKSSAIEAALGYKYCDEVIHRDDLVVM
ncbi:MAG: glutamate 5-kinase [Nitrospirota bacterium]